jgi:E3 ubiquitin-protein ligase UHRF1
VRVIRGYKLPSPYAPLEGYRYDGLYIVEKAWMGKGLTKGLMVCRYAFKRVPGQPELGVRNMDEEDAEDAEAEV